MATADQWNERFRRGEHSSLEPDAFIAGCAPYWDLAPGGAEARRAADLASGAGRHALLLAREGFRTTAFDFSEAALEETERRAASAGLAIETERVDLEADEAELGEQQFDAVVAVNFLHRPLFGKIRRALKPGGLIAYKAHTLDQLGLPGGPQNRAYLLQPNELLREFSNYRVLRYEERMRGEGTAAILAQKPLCSASQGRSFPASKQSASRY